MRHCENIPSQGVLAEVATVTFQRRPLLLPHPLLQAIFTGFLARAGRRTGIAVCAFTLTVDHYHLLLRVRHRLELGRFMAYLNAGFAREVNRMTGWGSFVWARRYRARVVPDEPEAQEVRLAALLRHPGSVGHPQVGSPPSERRIAGLWYDRSAESASRRRGQTVVPLAFASAEPLELAPLPAWDGLTAAARQERLRRLAPKAASPPRLAMAGGVASRGYPARYHLSRARCWVFRRRDPRETWLA